MRRISDPGPRCVTWLPPGIVAPRVPETLMRRPYLLLPFAAALALTGCLNTRNERVQTRRSPALIAQNERALEPLTPLEIDELFKRQEEERRLSPDMQRWN